MRSGRTCVIYRGRRLACFSGCDYYRLSSHPAVLQSVRDTIARHGLSVSASRMTTGNHKLYRTLERALARFCRSEAALLMPTGYVSATAVVQTLSSRISHAFIDERAHACLFDAARFLKCPVFVFKHRSPESLSHELQKAHDLSRVLLLTDGLFAHDGSAAPLRQYQSALPRGALMLVDDAHAVGILGAGGRGTLEHEGIKHGSRVIQTITLSKAFGAFGGAVLCSSSMRRDILKRGRVFVGSTPVPLPLAAAALKGLGLVSGNAAMRRRLKQNTLSLRGALRDLGYDLPENPGPIVRLAIGSKSRLNRFADRLLNNGVYPPIVRYLDSEASLRFVVSSEHTPAQLRQVIACFRRD